MDIKIQKLHTNGYNSIEEFFVGWPSVEQIHKIIIDNYGEERPESIAELIYIDGDAPIPGKSSNWISLDEVNYQIGES